MKALPLDRFEIDSFRGIEKMGFDQLGCFNLLVGGNNAGKTSVLEAVQCFLFPNQPASWSKIANSRNTGRFLSSNAFVRTDSLVWLFKHNADQPSDPYKLSLGGKGRHPCHRVEASLQFLQGQPDKQSLEDIKRNLGRTGQIIDDSSSFEGVELTLASYSAETLFGPEVTRVSASFWSAIPFVRGATAITFPVAFVYGHEYRSSELYADNYSQLRRVQQENVVKLAKLFDPKICNISVASKRERPYLKIEHEDMGEVPLMVFGDGIKRALFMATALVSAQNGILLIDEIEAGIHTHVMPDIMRWLLRAAQEMDVQVFATTHSLEALDALLAASKDTPEEFVAYRLDRERQLAQRLNHHVLSQMRIKGGLEIR